MVQSFKYKQCRNIHTGSTGCNASEARAADKEIVIVSIVQQCIVGTELVAIWRNCFRNTAAYTSPNTLQLHQVKSNANNKPQKT